jgi:redox-sensitive bicupin YhaK (pirin superfamily)
MGNETFFSHPVKEGYTAFAYVVSGQGTFDAQEAYLISNRDLILFSDGRSIQARSYGNGFHFLFISGKPIREPVAWRGPIVMNTQEELRQAFMEYEQGTFIKTKM